MSSFCTLSRRASFWVAAAVVAHTLWTSAAPSMTYQLYASEWGLTHTATAAIFAVFPIVVVAVLIFSGDISDYMGRRSTILIGLSSSLLGTALFAIAPGVLWVFVGRAFIGLGVGLCAGPAAAALLEFSAAGQETRASSINTLAQAVGIVLAIIVGGALIQYAPYPTHLNFWVLLVVLAVLFAAAWFLPRPVSNKAPRRWQPRLPSIPRGLRKIFAATAIAAATGYVIGGLMMSLGAQIAHDLVGSDNVLVNGVAIALFALAAGVVTIPGRRLTSRAAITVGGISSIVGTALLALSTARHSLPIFVAAATAGGIGFSLMYLGGLSLINANAPSDRRGGVLSALYSVAFAMQAIIVLLLGAAATTWGLSRAVDLGAVAIAVLSICTIGLALSIKGPVPREPGETNDQARNQRSFMYGNEPIGDTAIMSSGLIDNLPEALKTLRTRPLFVMRLDVRKLQIVGATPGGYRRVGVVPGGSFEGERLSGEVLDGGSDWQTVRTDGATTLNVRLVLRTKDEALIGMTYSAIRYGPPDIVARIEKGEVVDPTSYYFRINPLFETANANYDWLNRVVAVGSGHRQADGPIYSVFEVL